MIYITRLTDDSVRVHDLGGDFLLQQESLVEPHTGSVAHTIDYNTGRRSEDYERRTSYWTTMQPDDFVDAILVNFPHRA